MAKIVVAYGTRPEKVKLAPVIDELRDQAHEVVEWNSEQSRDLVQHGDAADDRWRWGLTEGVGNCMRDFSFVLNEQVPDAVVVQGDTATAFACAQAAFLARVPVAHVEAGMRTYASEPWPEEAFRRQIAAVARWHFAPGYDEARNLCYEHDLISAAEEIAPTIAPAVWVIDEMAASGIFVVGNTVIDTLPTRRMQILATLHRRENWGPRRRAALRELVMFGHAAPADVKIVRHPNGINDYNAALTAAEEREWVVPAMPREELLDHIEAADIIVTDSGGLQEEAAHFGKPTLVLRTATERVALERIGAITLVHPDDPQALRAALESALARRRCYGDGTASIRIADILTAELEKGA